MHNYFHKNRMFNGLDKDTYLSLTKPAVLNQQYQDDGATAIIDIDGYIGRDMMREFLTGEKSKNTVENMRDVLRDISSDKIIVNINSPGGDLNDGLVIYNMLQAHRADVVTNLMGFSASAATLIAQAGNVRRQSPESFKLIHRVMFGLMGYFNYNTLTEIVDESKRIDPILMKVYASRSNLSEKEVASIMDEGGGVGRWMNADEALEKGLIDEVYDPSDKDDDNTDHLDGEDSENRMRNIHKLNCGGDKWSDGKLMTDKEIHEQNIKINEAGGLREYQKQLAEEENKTNSGSAVDVRGREIDELQLKSKKVTP